MAEPIRAISLRQSCWAAGQCGAQGPVMCGAGLTAWSSSGRVGGEVKAEQGACVVFTGRCC